LDAGEQDLLIVPVDLDIVISLEGVYDTGNGGLFTTRDEVEIKHVLDSTQLQAVDDRACARSKEGTLGIGERTLVDASSGSGGADTHAQSVSGLRLVRGQARLCVGGRYSGGGSYSVKGGCGFVCRMCGSRDGEVTGHEGGSRGNRFRNKLVFLISGDGEAEGEGNNGGHMHFRTEDFTLELELSKSLAHELQTLDIVGSSATHVDAHMLRAEHVLILRERLDDALECSCHISEVGDTATDEEELALRMGLLGHEGEHCARVLVGLLRRGSTRILTVVGKLMAVPVISHSVAHDDAGTAAGRHEPNAAAGIEHGELHGCAGLAVERVDALFFEGGGGLDRGMIGSNEGEGRDVRVVERKRDDL